MRVTGYALHQNAGGMLSGGAYGPEGSVLTTVAAGVLFWVVTRAVDVDAVELHVTALDDADGVERAVLEKNIAHGEIPAAVEEQVIGAVWAGDAGG